MNTEHAEVAKKISLNIVYYRRLKGYTQNELAEKAGISKSHLSLIEAANMFANPKLDTFLKISDALDIPLYKIFVLRDDDTR